MEIYQPIDNALHHVGVLSDAAETHGILCGLLCYPPPHLETLWFQHLFADKEIKPSLLEKSKKQLLLVKILTVNQLQSPDFEFMPLLPEEDTPLPQRVEALGHWCDGFLLGLALAGIQIAQLPVEEREFIEDVIAISQIAPLESTANNEEHDYVQLVEFIKVGVLTLYEHQFAQAQRTSTHG
ncbi:MAG: UPF0149 family protein [Pseudomonadota bacterium]|nr:UPF0149 family protein [Pseudomonadota bacterium]